MRGKVRKWDDSKGYGFITDSKGRDVFCHYTQVIGDGFKSLVVGQEVEFTLYEGNKGLEAVEVKKV